MRLSIHHCTSEPFAFFGREAELALLNQALATGNPSVVAFVGPGGQGKTAILQHWLGQLAGERSHHAERDGYPCGQLSLEGVFFWSFYRGKDSDLCLRALYAAVAGLERAGEVSASYCVDHVLP